MLLEPICAADEQLEALCVLQGASQTMTTLKNLVHKGVKVDLGMPYELWDEPSVEVSDMKKQVSVRVRVHVRLLQLQFTVVYFKSLNSDVFL